MLKRLLSMWNGQSNEASSPPPDSTSGSDLVALFIANGQQICKDLGAERVSIFIAGSYISLGMRIKFNGTLDEINLVKELVFSYLCINPSEVTVRNYGKTYQITAENKPFYKIEIENR